MLSKTQLMEDRLKNKQTNTQWIITRLVFTVQLSSGDNITHFTERGKKKEYASKPLLMKKMPFKQIHHKAGEREGGREEKEREG